MKILILGAGEVGAYLARVLSAHAEIILIDRNQEALNAAEEGLDVLTVSGDITHRHVLHEADAAHAALVVAVTGSDDANLVGAALSADLGARRCVARVDDTSFYQTSSAVEAGVLGIHAVLCAARLVGDELLRLITQESADVVRSFAGNCLHVAGIAIKEFHPICGRPLSSVSLKAGSDVALILRDGRTLPPVDVTRIELGDVLLLTGSAVPLAASCRMLVGAAPRRAMIVGGGDVGMQLATTLAAFEGRVQLVERNAQRAEYLAEQLPGINIIHGDGSSVATLRDEHIQSVDYILALTRSDEVNLMVSLIARDLGVASTYTLVHRPGYEEIYRHLGVLGTTGPHDVLARAVERLVPRMKLQGGVPIPATKLECMELTLSKNLRTEVAPSHLSLPPGAHLLGRAEGGQLLKEHEQLRGGQVLVIAAPAHLFRDVEQALNKLGGAR